MGKEKRSHRVNAIVTFTANPKHVSIVFVGKADKIGSCLWWPLPLELAHLAAVQEVGKGREIGGTSEDRDSVVQFGS